MEYYVSITKDNITQYINDYDVLVCSLRPSRIKAKQLAIAELFFVLSRIGCIFIINGPLGDVKGLMSFFVDKKGRDLLREVLKTVGYCDKFYMLNFSPQSISTASSIVSINKLVWKGVPFSVHLFFEQSKKIYEEHSSHNREFYIHSSNGSVKKVKGYRGDGSDTGRRALPVEDTRLMVNLAVPYQTKVLLDPFAGSGGILYEARYIDHSLVLISADIDPILEPGLQMYADRHYTIDARDVELDGTEIDAIVTEVPFSAEITDIVAQVFIHLSSFLQEDARIVFMCADNQYNQLKHCMEILQLHCFMEKLVNRKGTDVIISVWYRSREQVERLQDFSLAVGKIY